MSPKKVELKEYEYQEVYTIFKKLTTVKNIPPLDLFKKNLDTFFELTYDAYVGYGGGKTETKASSSESSDAAQKARWAVIPKIKELYKDQKLASGRDRVLVAVAGGIDPNTARYALEMGADILIVGRFITSSKDIENSMRRLLNIIPGYSDIDLKRIHTEDDDNSVKKPTWD